MRLDTLRARLLLAIPVTIGCGAKAPKIEEPDEDDDDEAVATSPRQHEPDEPRRVPPDAADPLPHRADRCALFPDTAFETACGRVDMPRAKCDVRAGYLDIDRDGSSLYVTKDRETIESFVLDPDATDRYAMAHDGKGCCYVHCTELKVSSERFDLKHRVAGDVIREFATLPPPPGGTKVPHPMAKNCPTSVQIDRRMVTLWTGSEKECKYLWSERDPHHYKGRPARVDGTAHVADVAPAGDWCVPIVVTAVDDTVRARLVEYWLEAARVEHASIAAFAKLSLQLLVHGAPPDLLADAHAAARDEIEHARACFAIASRYAGRELGPAPFGDAARLSAAGDLVELARETFVDGCIGETCAAAEAARAAELATDPEIARVLATIAEDETRHAELAWRVVAWCIEREPAIARVLAIVDAPPVVTPDLPEHGVLGTRAIAELRARVLAEVIEPCLRALAPRVAA